MTILYKSYPVYYNHIGAECQLGLCEVDTHWNTAATS